MRKRLPDNDNALKPHHLLHYRPIASGLKYKVLGLFNLPENLDASHPCVYTVLATVVPPGATYKSKPETSMLGAHYFSEFDFEKSRLSSQLFSREQRDVELAGSVLKLDEQSALILDIKKFDLSNGELSDYGFAIQPLIHRLKDRNFIIAGRYQMPIYAGSVPPAFVTQEHSNKRPRTILKQLIDGGSVQPLGTM